MNTKLISSVQSKKKGKLRIQLRDVFFFSFTANFVQLTLSLNFIMLKIVNCT